MHRPKRSTRPQKTNRAVTEFNLIGPLIGGGCGVLVGFAIEVFTRPQLLISAACVLIGVTLGGLAQFARMQCLKRVRRRDQPR
jgi:hypothetical protein